MNEYYTTQSKFTDPGKYLSLYQDLPHDVGSLTEIIRGLVVHQHETEKYYGFPLPKGREIEPNTRYAEKIIEKILQMDSSPLTISREPQKRFIGLCRDFGLLLCSILRSKRVPARVRCGFANYFSPTEHLDHWLCEYWSEKENRWILVDTEVDALERESYSIAKSFNNLDITHDEFWYSSKAWKALSAHPETEHIFGVPSIGVDGAWFVRASLFRDLATLNKIELCPWDSTEYGGRQYASFSEIEPEEVALLNALVEAIDSDDTGKKARDFYESHPHVQIGKEIISNTNLGPVSVQLS